MTSTVGFSIADDDRRELDELVEYFGGGNRSEYLRATLKVMRSVRNAQQLRDLQVYGQEKLAARGLALDDIPGLIKKSRQRG